MSAEYFEYYTIILRGGRFFVDTVKYCRVAQFNKNHTFSEHHIDATVNGKTIRFSPKCSEKSQD